MSLEYRIGDVWDRMREIPDQSIDCLITSPPFLALRSYLPADHPDKAREIGSEATPAAFIDTLLALTAEWGRVLAPHGSLCVELGDTFSGSGGAGGDYATNGLREGQGKFDGSGRRSRAADVQAGILAPTKRPGPEGRDRIPGWPLAKSLTGIPEAYMLALAYGINPLTGAPSPAGRYRVRNQIVWARPNPPVGALGDKFRPATSYITVACRGTKRYFDLDAVRGEALPPSGRQPEPKAVALEQSGQHGRGMPATGDYHANGGAPPLDWHTDHHPEDGDWLWKLSTQPYAGSHYATFPMALPKRLIEAMCPLRVCTVCGRPSERIVEGGYIADGSGTSGNRRDVKEPDGRMNGTGMFNGKPKMAVSNTMVGWSDCGCSQKWSGHNTWRTGIVLDPFAGSGTTLEAAQAVGRHAIGIDLDSRNGDLARERVGLFLKIDEGAGSAA